MVKLKTRNLMSMGWSCLDSDGGARQKIIAYETKLKAIKWIKDGKSPLDFLGITDEDLN